MPESSDGAALDPLDSAKRELRKLARQNRAGLRDGAALAGQALAARFLESIDLGAVNVVSAFWPLGAEIDTRPLMEQLHQRGHAVVLPVVIGPAQALAFRLWTPGDALVPAGFGTMEPAPDKPERDPDLLAVPLLAFDAAGYRLGYGGGFYDRTLLGLRGRKAVRAVGLAYHQQEVETVPRGPYDQPLDAIVTDRATRFFGAADGGTV